MAWNEPGRNGNGDDPWGSGRGGRGGGNQGPPDIDEVIRNIVRKFNEAFGGGSSSGGSGSSGRRSGGFSAFSILLLGFVAVAAVWFLLGIYRVEQPERGVVLRFGKVLPEVVTPGLNWNPPLIDEVRLVNTRNLYTKEYENRGMLTTDENIIDIRMEVQYEIPDPVSHVIAVQDPLRSLDNAAESAIRHVVGGNSMDQILTTGRSQVAEDVEIRLQTYMDMYLTGIRVVRVNLADAQPPEAVRPAFDDVIRAREDEERAQNEAQQYANRIIPEARGEAAREIEQANAYKEEIIARAGGDAARFSQLLEEYRKAPLVTRQRMYIESMQDVMTASSKVMIDVEGGNNMLYVPLDKILEGRGAPGSTTAQELRALADQLAPYLPVSGGGGVDSTRLNTSRGARQ